MRWTTRFGICAIGLALAASSVAGKDPDPASAPRLTVQLGHGDAVQAVAFSPRGTFLLTGSWDKTACLWEAATGRELRRFEGHLGGISSVAFARDGRHVLTGSLDKTAKLWDAQSGREVKRFGGHDAFVTAVAFNMNGSAVATGCRDKAVRIFDPRTGSEIRELAGHTGAVTGVAFHPADTHLASASDDGTVRLWDLRTGGVAMTYRAQARLSCVAISSDGEFVLAGGDDNLARIWKLRTGKEVQRFAGHTKRITSVAFTPDGRYVLTGSSDKTARLFEIRSAKEARRFGGHDKWVHGVAVSPDGLYAVTASSDARLWDVRAQKKLLDYRGHGGEITSLAVSDDGFRLITGSADEAAHLWDLRLGREIGRFVQHRDGVHTVAFAPDGKAFGNGCGDGKAHIVDAESGAERQELTAGSGPVRAMTFSKDGAVVLTGHADNVARLWDAQSGRMTRELRGHTGQIRAVALTPDGRSALTGSEDKSVRVWDVATGRERARLDHEHPVQDCRFSADGTQVFATAGWGVAQWDVARRQVVRRFNGHRDWATALALSADGSQLLTGSRDRAVVRWDVRTGKEIRRYEGHGGAIRALAFLPGDAQIVTGSTDMTARVWNTASGAHLCTLASLRDGTWAVVAPDGRFDASNGGAVEGLHWVVGANTLSLEQLKVRYYEPGLLAKLLGHNKEPARRVEKLAGEKLFPAVEAEQKGGKLSIRLRNQGGGIGRVVVLVNGKERTADARGANADVNAQELALVEDLSDDPRLLAGKPNRIEVLAYNADGYLRSRGLVVTMDKQGEAPTPHLWSVVVGNSDYAGKKLDLRFAAADARDFAKALDTASKSLFGAERTHITLLTDATRAQILEATAKIQGAAKPGDILVVFLAGHGVSHGDAFYYLTAEAQDAEMDDAAARKAKSLSGDDIAEAVNGIHALKQVLILDTCASGQIMDSLSGRRSAPSSQVRALDRVKDRTGMFVLAGCAADKVSYEATRYGQGLLTYSLLLGMGGAKLRENEYVDVALLFGFAADRVPAFAKDLGGVQRPVVAVPRGGGSFDIGRLTGEQRKQVPVRPVRPMFIRASFQDSNEGADVLDLALKVNDVLYEETARAQQAPIVFVDVPRFAGAYAISGSYTTQGETTRVRFRLRQGKDALGDWIELEGSLDTLPRQIVTEALRRLPKGSK